MGISYDWVVDGTTKTMFGLGTSSQNSWTVQGNDKFSVIYPNIECVCICIERLSYKFINNNICIIIYIYTDRGIIIY